MQRDEEAKPKENVTYVCQSCESPDIEVCVWFDPNAKRFLGHCPNWRDSNADRSFADWPEEAWCRRCEDETFLEEQPPKVAANEP